MFSFFYLLQSVVLCVLEVLDVSDGIMEYNTPPPFARYVTIGLPISKCQEVPVLATGHVFLIEGFQRQVNMKPSLQGASPLAVWLIDKL